MKKLIMHILEAQFKMIHYYGIYAACNHHHKDEIKKKLSTNKNIIIKDISYRQELIDTFDTDPLLCNCGHYKKYLDYWVPPSKRKELIIMTVANIDEDGVFDIQLASTTEKDSIIDMKCTSCGYEEKMLEWCYAEEADFLIDEGDPEPPTWQCPKCYKETLVRKPD